MSDQRERIQSLLALAQHPNTPQAEAETALAMASKLMLKHGLTDSDIADIRAEEDTSVIYERVSVAGPYRVRRVAVLYEIALAHSCAAYRARDEHNEVILVIYGRASDIFAARTLFAAAEAMAARLLPRGDRSWRVAWWHGFQSGIGEALASSRKEFIKETPGSGLVLSSRADRAEHEMRATVPGLSRRTSYINDSGSAYASGQQAGRGFTTGGRSFTSGVRGELG